MTNKSFIEFIFKDEGLIPGLNNLLQILVISVPLLIKVVNFLIKVSNQRYLHNKLKPYFSDYEVYKATECFISTKCQNIDPGQELEPMNTIAFATKEKLIPFMIKSFDSLKENKYYLILADSGMGKTTFMINLYLSYKKQITSKRKIQLFPLGHPNVEHAISSVLNKENTILLLDAFDEDTLALVDHKDRLSEIVELTKDYHTVVITCRTQFFPRTEEEPHETGILKYGTGKGQHRFYKLYIAPFDSKDIKRYLRKRFAFYSLKDRRIAKAIVNLSPNLMVRPMLLSHIEDLIQTQCYTYCSEIYEKLIQKWIDRERVENKEDLKRFNLHIAEHIYATKEKKKGLFLYASEFEGFAKIYNISLYDFEMKSRSLLNRDPEGKYKFSHKSILEYLLAKIMMDDYEFRRKFNYEGMDLVKRFYSELIWTLKLYPLINSKEFADDLKINVDERNCTLDHLDKIVSVTISFPKVKLEILSCLPALKTLKISNVQKFLLSNFCHTSLKELSIVDSVLPQIDLGELPSLESLDLNSNQILDIGSIYQYTRLNYLVLSKNRLSNLESIRALLNLKSLVLDSNMITNIEPIEELNNLIILDLSNNYIHIIESLKKLKNLRLLDLSNNPIKDWSSFCSLTNLAVLNLQRCKNVDLKYLGKITNLSELYLTESTIKELHHPVMFNSLKTLHCDDQLFSILSKRIISMNREFKIVHPSEFQDRKNS